MEPNESDLSSEGSDFVATDEMLTLAYDDESTINDEEDIAEEDDVADEDEIQKLKLESEMPLEELLRLYDSQLVESEVEPIKYSLDTCYSNEIGPKVNSAHVTDNQLQCESNNENNKTSENSDNEDKGENDPPRGSNRLWCKALIENNSNYNSEDDGDYIPIINSKLFSNAKIRIGENYQAMIPGINSVNSQAIDLGVLQLRCNEILLWKCLNDSDDFQLDLMRYFQRYGEISGQTRLINGKIDDATALYTLMEQDYDLEAAVTYLKNKPISPSNLPTIMQSWSEQECVEFERGFEIHNKNFKVIKEQLLRTRSVAEIVEFYYFWKKTARYDEFIRWCKRDKKKPLNQITDFIDCLGPTTNGKKENYLLGNWPGVKVNNDILKVSEDNQTAQFLNKLLMCNGSEHEHVKNGSWNMITSHLTMQQKESGDTNSDNLTKEIKTSPETSSTADSINNNDKY